MAAAVLFAVLPHSRFSRTLKGMEVHLTNPDLQAKLERWIAETARKFVIKLECPAYAG